MNEYIAPDRDVVSGHTRDGAPMNILQVCARYDPFTGGTETHVKEVSKRLRSMGHDVTILTTDPCHTLPAVQSVDDLLILRIRSWPAQRDFGFAPGVFKTIVLGEWDIVHLQGYHTLVAPLAMAAASRAGIPYVVSFHSGGHSSPARTIARGAQRRLLGPYLKRASRLVPVSQFEAGLFGNTLGLPPECFTVIPNGSDLSVSPPAVNEPASSDDGPLIVSVGRAEKYKGHHRLIQALPHLRKTYLNARLRIVGDGAYAQTLRQLASDMGLAHAVDVRGIAPSDRGAMARLLSHASIVALLSEYEAHPVALVEALSLGKKIIAADTSGMSELAAFSQVKTIPLSLSDDEVARAIADHIEAAVRPEAVAVPTWDECAQRLAHLYREVLASADVDTRATHQPSQAALC